MYVNASGKVFWIVGFHMNSYLNFSNNITVYDTSIIIHPTAYSQRPTPLSLLLNGILYLIFLNGMILNERRIFIVFSKWYLSSELVTININKIAAIRRIYFIFDDNSSISLKWKLRAINCFRFLLDLIVS